LCIEMRYLLVFFLFCFFVLSFGQSSGVQTTTCDGLVNGNAYLTQEAVFVTNGPDNCPENGGLADGTYYFQVTEPNGNVVLSTDPIENRQFEVVNGYIVEYISTCAALNKCPAGGSCPCPAHETCPGCANRNEIRIGLSPYNPSSVLSEDKLSRLYKVHIILVTDYIAHGNSFGSGAKTDNFNVACPLCGDPHFQGIKGQHFDFHGHAGGTYLIYSDPKILINANFVGGLNPKKNLGHGTWVGTFGFRLGDINVTISANQEDSAGIVISPTVSMPTKDILKLKCGYIKINKGRYTQKGNLHDWKKLTIFWEQYSFAVSRTAMGYLELVGIVLPEGVTEVASGVLGQTIRSGEPNLEEKNWEIIPSTDLFKNGAPLSTFDETLKPRYASSNCPNLV